MVFLGYGFTPTRGALIKIMRAGWARWTIENETFKALRNQGYHFGNNFGQGQKHLSSVFANLMVLAFLIDQIELRCSGLFRDALARSKLIKYFREKARDTLREFITDSWDVSCSSIVEGYNIRLRIDSS
ncbi:MAG: hypothetical protein F4058_03285 [Rhodothermaceae bacterium]|nr:hypothetical protein [Rhodothermaceae bacterium]MYI84339.1 hypothetical protein [Rhodothermaceae bacterium]